MNINCSKVYYSFLDNNQSDTEFDESEASVAERFGIREDVIGPDKRHWWKRYKPRTWIMLEEPYSSQQAWVRTMSGKGIRHDPA